MEEQVGIQAMVSDQTALDPERAVTPIAIFNANGTLVELGADGAKGDPGADGADGIQPLVTVATAIGTAAKTTTADEPAANTVVPIKFTNGNSANSPTVAFNGGAARAIQLGGTASTGAKCTIAAGGVGFFWFDGTILHQLGAYT